MSLLLFAVACSEGGNDIVMENLCEEMKILKVFEDEPATVQKKCFEHIGRVDAFYFVLETKYPELHIAAVFPIEEIPKLYRKEGMAVKISGNVTDCLVASGCIEPDIRLASINLFELKSIKINN